MSKPRHPASPDDNPAWTDEDFARAVRFEQLPERLKERLASVRRRGPQRSPTKVRTALRLSPEVLEHFKAGGPGWQTRIDEALLATIKGTQRRRRGSPSDR